MRGGTTAPNPRNEFRGNELVLLGAIVGLTAGVASTLFYSLGSFISPLEREFGWSRGDLSLALTLTATAILLSGALTGRLCDHYGSRRVATASLVAYSLGLVVLALSVTRIEHLWIGYFGVAVLGMGSTPIGLVKPVADAFDRNRGLALGVALTGTGIAGSWVPRLVTGFAEAYRWRAGHLGLAAVALLAAPTVWFALRASAARRRARDDRNGSSMGVHRVHAFPQLGSSDRAGTPAARQSPVHPSGRQAPDRGDQPNLAGILSRTVPVLVATEGA